MDTDFNGAPISLLERNRQIGEWFYITPEDEAIAIFSAAHDDFIPITYADAEAARHDLDDTKKQALNTAKQNVADAQAALAGANPGDDDAVAAAKANLATAQDALAQLQPNILIFRPFQTWRMAVSDLSRRVYPYAPVSVFVSPPPFFYL